MMSWSVQLCEKLRRFDNVPALFPQCSQVSVNVKVTLSIIMTTPIVSCVYGFEQCVRMEQAADNGGKIDL